MIFEFPDFQMEGTEELNLLTYTYMLKFVQKGKSLAQACVLYVTYINESLKLISFLPNHTIPKEK